MSAAWKPLLPVALVGTERQPGPLPDWPGELGEVLAQVSRLAADPASAVLGAASVLAVCGLAGAQGATWSAPMPPRAAADAWPALADGPLLTLVRWSLHDGPARLHQQVFLNLSQKQWRLPAVLLPQALDLGRRSMALRTLMLPALGERGQWLAAQREEWRHAAGVAAPAADESRWSDGSLDQRREFLARERRENPAVARERLEQALDELPAKERADLVAVLAHGLGPQDEPLLDRLRGDRSKEVRQAALQLLLQLPAAAHPQRATQRVAVLLQQERVLLRKKWVVDAPTAADESWKADNVDATRPNHESLGERAWWLYQLVRQVPLPWWSQHTGMTPAELRDWANSTDWTEALLRGWCDALLAAPDEAWCEAFLDQVMPNQLSADMATLLALLPPAKRERHWQGQLQGGVAAIAPLVQQMLGGCPPGETLSAPLSATLADLVRQRAASNQLFSDYGLRSMLPDLCCILHVDALEPLVQLPRLPDDTSSYTDLLHTVTQVVTVRRAFHTLANSRTP